MNLEKQHDSNVLDWIGIDNAVNVANGDMLTGKPASVLDEGKFLDNQEYLEPIVCSLALAQKLQPLIGLSSQWYWVRIPDIGWKVTGGGETFGRNSGDVYSAYMIEELRAKYGDEENPYGNDYVWFDLCSSCNFNGIKWECKLDGEIITADTQANLFAKHLICYLRKNPNAENNK